MVGRRAAWLLALLGVAVVSYVDASVAGDAARSADGAWAARSEAGSDAARRVAHLLVNAHRFLSFRRSLRRQRPRACPAGAFSSAQQGVESIDASGRRALKVRAGHRSTREHFFPPGIAANALARVIRSWPPRRAA